MYKHSTLLLLFVLLLAPLVGAQDMEKPTIALLRYGPYITDPIVERGLLDILQVYEWITAEERAQLDAGQNLEGEQINIIWGAAGFDLPTVNLMVEDALDRGVDVLVASGAPVTQIASNITLDQDEPTPIVFHSVYSPRQYGIIEAPCLKLAHVTGSEYTPPYEEAFAIFRLQNPQLERLGAIHTSTDAGGSHGAAVIQAIGAAQGIEVEVAAITRVSDLRAATQGLANAGVEAIMLPLDFTIGSALPIIVSAAKENQIPVFHPIPGSVMTGVTLGAGFFDYYSQGVHTGLLLDAHLNDGIDFESTAVRSFYGDIVGVNLDVAAEMGIAFPPELLEMADLRIRDGALLMSQEMLLIILESMGADEAFMQMGLQIAAALGDSFDWSPWLYPAGDTGDSPMAQQLNDTMLLFLEMRKSPENKAKDAAALESLQCTAENIAEQQAALDAAEA